MPRFVENQWWQIINSSLVVFFLGLIATVTVINIQNTENLKQQKAEETRQEQLQWERDRRAEVFRDELVKTRETIDTVSALLKERYYYTYTLLTFRGERIDFNSLSGKYDAAATELATRVQLLRDNLLLYIENDELAYELIDKSNNGEKNNSIYRVYFDLGDSVKRKVVQVKSGRKAFLSEELSKKIIDMGLKTDDYILRLNLAFKAKYKKYIDGINNSDPKQKQS